MLPKLVLPFQSLSNLSHFTFSIKIRFNRVTFIGFTSLFLLSFSALVSISVHGAEVNILKHQENIHTRTLAASCAACHGTRGNSQSVTPVLAGLDAAYFSTQMLAFKNGSRDSTVMHRHAKGLTIDEIDHLADYFSKQKRVSTPAPISQRLKARNE